MRRGDDDIGGFVVDVGFEEVDVSTFVIGDAADDEFERIIWQFHHDGADGRIVRLITLVFVIFIHAIVVGSAVVIVAPMAVAGERLASSWRPRDMMGWSDDGMTWTVWCLGPVDRFAGTNRHV